MKVVYYFGDKYYELSGTMMGVLYTESGEQYDWGFMQRDICKGQEVLVRPATPAMIAWAEEQLEGCQV